MDTKPKIDTNADVVNQYTGEKWYYTDIVKDHFFNPRNLMLEDPDESQYQAIGMVGSPACIAGDMNIALPALQGIVPIRELSREKQVDVYSYDGTDIIKGSAFHIRKTRDHTKVLNVILDDNSYVVSTPDHEFMKVDDTYCRAVDLHRGDILKTFNRVPYRIKKVIVRGYEDVYDMTVDAVHNFMIALGGSRTNPAGIFVHNCGDMMKMWLKIEPQTEKVKEMNWRTFGCGSAIAATSMFSVMITENGGLPIEEALKIKPQNIMERLGGLPNRKIHCSVLADKAFRKAANDYFRRTGQTARIIVDGAKVIDAKLNITDKDIEEAVLEGAVDLDGVQKKLKVGIGSPEVIPEVEQLIRFYKEKYYG